MSHLSALKQIFSKNVRFKIEIMEWSNKMDLLAISNDKNEVIIHRLNWQNVWIHSPPNENTEVKSIAWRPDEKIIAIGYSNGTVVLLDIENKEELHSFQLNGEIVNLSWTQNTRENSISSITDQNDSIYLPQLPNLNSLSSSHRKKDYITRSYSKNILNFLIVALKTGIVHLSVFGMLPCGTVNIVKHLKDNKTEFQVIDAKISANFQTIYTFIQTNDSLHLMIFENEIIPKFSSSLLQIATKHSQILNTMSYINDTIQSIIEAWETVLLEMDNKLTKFANVREQGSVSADFLELLVFGNPSEELEQFLTRELTEKGLKKLGNCIELSYSTIQKLVVRPLHTAILNICYHLNTVKGMKRNKYFYGNLLSSSIDDAIQNAGSFLIKGFELQQTIDQSTRDYKIFFRWLYVVIIRLMDETVPEDISTMTQQEINYLAEFLNNLDDDDDDENDLGVAELEKLDIINNRKFNLERVGQYLEDKNLHIVQSSSQKDAFSSQWDALLNENQCLKNSNLIYPHDPKLSLVQQHTLLKRSIENVFQQPEIVITETFQLKNVIKCADNNLVMDVKPFQVSYISLQKDKVDMFAILLSETTLLFVELHNQDNIIKTLLMEFQKKSFFDVKYSQMGDISFRHLQFYNDDTLSLLLNNRTSTECGSCFVQFPIALARNKAIPMTAIEMIDITKSSAGAHGNNIVNMYDMLDSNNIKAIDGNDWHVLAVSGNRKVASILSESQRKIRIYETEADEDEDEMDLSQNTTLGNTSKDSNQ